MHGSNGDTDTENRLVDPERGVRRKEIEVTKRRSSVQFSRSVVSDSL